MKKYNKPTIEVVNLKSSENIAASFDNIRGQFIQDYLKKDVYAVSRYAITQSVVDAATSNS